ncbi:hypothetical protein EYC84_006805 [Monilinia fructicola]|uniref:Uncharacterized protein n=1 Tax=Monilinia fructicola TaxID=38448 RepID=A0A5M9K795_MONFR|nr:hypothetical protein EYC84_006805 [Monilinia fructicola]
MFPTRGDPYQNRPTDSRSRPHQDNPFDDSNYTRLPPSWQGGIHAQESGGSYISRTGQANRSSVGMARGSSSKGPGTIRNREQVQESLDSDGDLFELLISSQDEDKRTYERYHTARELQGTQHIRGGTPPTMSANYYHQSPSYSIRGDTSGAYSNPALVAKGPGSNAARTFGGSSTISFTNTLPSGTRVVNDDANNLSSVNHPKATNLKTGEKGEEEEVQVLAKFYYCFCCIGQPAILGLERCTIRFLHVDLQWRPQPVRVTAEARAQYNARKEDQRLALERRLAVPHLIRRSPPVGTGLCESFKLLTRNAWILVVVASFGLLSMVICFAVIVTIKNVGDNPSENPISIPIIWWLVASVLVFCGGIVAFVVLRVCKTPQRSEIGFRNRIGPNEIIDGSLRHGGDLESGFNGQSFEMVSGSRLPRYGRSGTTNGSPAPRQETLSSFDSPNTVQNAHEEDPRQIVGRFERVPIASDGFDAVPVHGTGEESYFGRRLHSSGKTDDAGFMAKSPATPLTPLPQAVLSPTIPRNINDFSISHYRTPSRPCAPIGIPTPDIPDIPEDPEAVSTRVSTRSRDSLIAAGAHRNRALKSLLGETPAPDEILGITDIYDGNRQSVGSAAPSLTSTYSFVPSPLKRVETEGPLARLEKSLTHQSQKIATEQELPTLSRNPWRESMNENDEILPATFYTNSKGKGRAYD